MLLSFPLEIHDRLIPVCAPYPSRRLILVSQVVSLNRPVVQANEDLMWLLRSEAERGDRDGVLEILANRRILLAKILAGHQRCKEEIHTQSFA